MKLTYKLTLSFLAISLIIISLAAFFLWSTTSTQFNQYLVDQRQNEFVSIARNHFLTHGDWKDVDITLRSSGLLPPFAPPGSPQPDPQPFTLVNMNHQVVVPGGEYQQGQNIPPGVLSKGIEIMSNGEIVGIVLTSGQSPKRSPIDERYLKNANQSFIIAAAGGVIISLLLGFFIASTLTKPLLDLITATHEMARGKFDHQVPVHSQDEIGELAIAFNQMSNELFRSNQSRRQMTADIAHDLRNPLTVINGYLESLIDGKLLPTQERFETMQSEVQHLQSLVNDLRILSLADSGELILKKQSIAPLELLERLADTFNHQISQQGITLDIECNRNVPTIEIDCERIEQVFGNLLNNSLRYTQNHGKILLSAKNIKGGVMFSVQDNGSGIAPEVLPHVFERSYRGDTSRNNNQSGLGLSIAKSIIELHGGTINVTSEGIGKGAQFWLFFPTHK